MLYCTYIVFLSVSKWPTRYYFKNKLRTIQHQNLEKLRAASLNLNFTGCYKKDGTSKFFIKLARKWNEHPLNASKNLCILFLASQLLNLGCSYHWKY